MIILPGLLLLPALIIPSIFEQDCKPSQRMETLFMLFTFLVTLIAYKNQIVRVQSIKTESVGT